jgi:hypothetical protein
VPFETVSLCRSRGVPAITGSAVFTGGCGGPTSPVDWESAVTGPASLVAVTRSAIVAPTSVAVRRYVVCVEPSTGSQVGLHRSHW